MSWLAEAGLREVEVRIFPRVRYPVDADPTTRPYLELAVWPTILATGRR